MSATAATPIGVDLATAATRPRSRLASRAGRRFVWAAAAVAVVSVLFILAVGLNIGGDRGTTATDDIGEAIAALVAAASCGYAALTRTGRLRLTWALIGLSAFSWFAGEVVWSVYEVGLGQDVPFPSAAK